MVKGKLAILVGGGPAPGINSVIGAATIRSRLEGVEVLGLPDGFEHVMEGDVSEVRSLDIDDVSRIHFRGGSILGISRANPTKSNTLKRALTDPRLFSGIGNAYSDEILHRARLSPVQMTTNLSPEEIARLFEATQTVLNEWIERLRKETGSGFPEKVTAFRPEMAVHGRYNQPCPDCGAPVQRIAYAENETNYCARCQTAGRLLADRSLSRRQTERAACGRRSSCPSSA